MCVYRIIHVYIYTHTNAHTRTHTFFLSLFLPDTHHNLHVTHTTAAKTESTKKIARIKDLLNVLTCDHTYIYIHTHVCGNAGCNE